MANKEPEEKDSFIELIKKFGSPILGIIGAVTSIFNFYQLWSGNQATIIYIFAGSGFLLLLMVLVWVGFSKKDIPKRGNRKTTKSVFRYSLLYRRIAWSGMVILILLSIFGIRSLFQHRTEQENKLIVLIAGFEGPEETYGLRNEIIENLNNDFSGDENIEIISIDEVITISNGSEYARKLGVNHLADIIIWGWYRPTENPNINIHIENLSSGQLFLLEDSETLRPITTLNELESFSFQQQTGIETSALISFLAGFIEYKSENYETAIKYFDISLETLPESLLLFENQFETYLYRGHSYSFLNEHERAIQDYEQAIKINPKYASAYRFRGNVYSNMGNFGSAIQAYNEAIQINPQYVEAYMSRGNVYYDLSEYELAIQDYDQAIKIDPENENAYLFRGFVYSLGLSESKRAIQDYNQAIKINPQNSLLYFFRGYAYSNLEDYDNAIRDYDKAIKIEPQDASAYRFRGNAYNNLGEYERAIQNYNKAIQIEPHDASTYISRGNAYTKLDRYIRAIQDYDQAIKIEPQDADNYFFRGYAYAILGYYKRAIQDYDQAIKIEPQNESFYYLRGNAYNGLGEYERAIQDYDQSIQINPQFVEAYNDRGIAYGDLNEYERAIQDYDQGIKINPQYADAYYNRGLAYQKLGKLVEAEADFAKYKELTGQDAP